VLLNSDYSRLLQRFCEYSKVGVPNMRSQGQLTCLVIGREDEIKKAVMRICMCIMCHAPIMLNM
jgi:hypothetical protein